jgi:chemotaxis family two-component system sensor kinase Cph1
MRATTLAPGTPIDLTNCDREPIHIPGAIQPHGALVALDEDSLKVVLASDNAGPRLGATGAIRGVSLDAFLDTRALRDALAAPELRDANPLRLVARTGASFDGIAHRSGGLVVLELEPASSAQEVSFSDFYRHVRLAASRLQRASSLAQMCEMAAVEVRRLTGFDRVMAYRFDRDDHGHVIAEAKRDELESFLDLHYPASDIPAQARRLYTLNWLRFIVDASYHPSPLEPALNPRTGAPLDLSFAVLRSVSPIHLEYLRNMGVSASMSISLVHDGRLWGMLICHHYSPRFVPYDVRSACEFLGQALSWQVGTRERGEASDRRAFAQATLARLVDRLAGTSEIALGLAVDSRGLLALVDAAGAAVRTGGAWATFGEAPAEAELDAIARWVLPRMTGGTFSTDAFGRLEGEPPANDALASGVLAVTLSAERGDLIAWFRPETVRTVDWAGDPNKLATLSDGAPRLTPRGSFALWKETVRGRAAPWQTWEVEAVGGLRQALVGNVMRRNEELAELNSRLRAASSQLSVARDALEITIAERTSDLEVANKALEERAAELARSNLELERFAYVASHDLQEPLRMVVSYVQLLERRYKSILDADAHEFMGFAVDGAKRMQTLINDLLTYSRVGRHESRVTPVAADAALEAALSNLKTGLEENEAHVTRDAPLPVVRADSARLTQVFQNLIGNALKFRGEAPPHIHVGATRIDEDDDPARGSPGTKLWRFTVRDNGIGIAPQHQERIFVIFQRLHTRGEYPGTGIGLAICKKVIELFGGHIGVESEAGKGATFWFTLPAAESDAS